MKTQEELEPSKKEAIQKIEAEYKMESYFANLFVGIPHNCISHSDNPFVTFKLESGQQSIMRQVFSTCPSDPKEKSVLGFEGKEDHIIDYPYLLRLENPATQNSTQRSQCKISWKSGKYTIWLQIPMDWVRDYIYGGTRIPNSSEFDIYYPRMTAAKMRKFTVPCYGWGTQSQQSYYGWDNVLINANKAEEIINHLKSL